MRVTLLGLVLFAKVSCFAQNFEPMHGTFRRQIPLSIAPAKIKIENHGRIEFEVGAWQPYNNQSFFPTSQTLSAFDEFEYSIAGNGAIVPDQNPNFGSTCSPPLSTPGSRYSFGNSFTCGLTYNDMKIFPAAEGKISARCGVGYTWRTNQFLNNATIFVGTCENWSLSLPSANDGSISGRHDYVGVLLNFGQITTNNDPLYADVDLSSTSLGWTLPADGQGGSLLVCGDFNTITNTMTLGKGQPLHWGLKSANPFGPESGFEWLDAFPEDGSLGSSDLFDFTGTPNICPNMDSLGQMVCFFYDSGSSQQTLAPSNLSVLLGNVTAGGVTSLNSDDGQFLRICKALVPTLTSPKLRFDLDYLCPFLPPGSITQRVTGKMANGGLYKLRGMLADRGGGGFSYPPSAIVIQDQSMSLALQSYSGSSSNPASQIGTDRIIRARLEIYQTGLSPVPVPCSEFDSVTLDVSQ